MLRTVFAALGMLFALLLVFTASFLGNVALDIQNRSDEYEALTIDVTRTLSRSWRLAAIDQHYVDDAREELRPVLSADMEELKPLGALLYVDAIQVETRWSRGPLTGFLSPMLAAERVAELLNRSVKVSFVGKFAGGLADVTAELKREGGRMKIVRLRVESREKGRPLEYPAPRIISHA